MVAPVIEDLAGEHTEVQFAKLDVDQVPDIALRFNVAAIPTVVLFKAQQGSAAVRGCAAQKRVRTGTQGIVISERKTLHEEGFFL